LTEVATTANGKICLISQGCAFDYLSQKPTSQAFAFIKKVKFEADVVKFSDFSNPYCKDWRHELEFKFDRS